MSSSLAPALPGLRSRLILPAITQLVVLEMEDRPGYHSTGRSAATYEPNYGPAPSAA